MLPTCVSWAICAIVKLRYPDTKSPSYLALHATTGKIDNPRSIHSIVSWLHSFGALTDHQGTPLPINPQFRALDPYIADIRSVCLTQPVLVAIVHHSARHCFVLLKPAGRDFVAQDQHHIGIVSDTLLAQTVVEAWTCE